MVDTSDEWIVTRTGIHERRIATEEETVAKMGASAAENALEMADIDRQEIGLIIVATTSGSCVSECGMSNSTRPRYC